MIEEKLRAWGLDAPGCRAAGRLQTIDAAVTLEQFMIGEEADWDRFLSEVGGAVARGIAAFRRAPDPQPSASCSLAAWMVFDNR